MCAAETPEAPSCSAKNNAALASSTTSRGTPPERCASISSASGVNRSRRRPPASSRRTTNRATSSADNGRSDTVPAAPSLPRSRSPKPGSPASTHGCPSPRTVSRAPGGNESASSTSSTSPLATSASGSAACSSRTARPASRNSPARRPSSRLLPLPAAPSTSTSSPRATASSAARSARRQDRWTKASAGKVFSRNGGTDAPEAGESCKAGASIGSEPKVGGPAPACKFVCAGRAPWRSAARLRYSGVMHDPQPGQPLSAPRELARLLDIMARLREPITGCPWDAAQTFETIAPYTIEEAYEVADAIARRDMDDLPDELGDLLFQVVYHARMAEEAGLFAFADVARAIADKMLRRHPHVFGDAPSAGWEEHKREERAARRRTGTLDAVPAALPALTRALKLTARAGRVGFDWPDAAHVLDKLDEEIAELRAEMPCADPARLADEMGDILFVAANLARKLGLDPEACLRGANAKFTRRFAAVEARVAHDGLALADAGLDRMEAHWQAVKADEPALPLPPGKGRGEGLSERRGP